MRRQGGDDPANIANEAEVQHAVGLVQHEVADLVQFQLAGGHQVADAAGRADHDVGASPHPLHLHEAADAAENRNDATRHPIAEPVQTRFDLQCQFAGRRQDEGARGVTMRLRRIGCEVLQHRQRECGGLAGAGLGDAEQVAAGEEVGNGCCLDRRWLEEVFTVEGTQQRLGQAERRKGNRWHENGCSSARRRGFMPAAKGERLDVRLPARQWGERVAIEFPGGHIVRIRTKCQSRIHGMAPLYRPDGDESKPYRIAKVADGRSALGIIFHRAP